MQDTFTGREGGLLGLFQGLRLRLVGANIEHRGRRVRTHRLSREESEHDSKESRKVSGNRLGAGVFDFRD